MPKRPPTSPPSTHPEVVSPAWLVKALAIALLVAACFAYLSVCFLVYQGSWQLMLHPSRVVDKTPATAFQSIRFDSAATGSPRLTAWWVPAESSSARTILLLHDATGSLSSTLPTLELLHAANLNVFVFDYRGFGQSDPTHPTESRMQEDASAALTYLTQTRHIPAAQIIPYGQGLGAALAATLLNTHPELPALILEDTDPSAFDRVAFAGRARLLPMRTLIQEHFDVTAALAQSGKPKLLLADTPFTFDLTRVRANQSLFRTAPDPKVIVTFDPHPAVSSNGLHPPSPSGVYIQTLQRFLDEYVPAPIPTLHPAQ